MNALLRARLCRQPAPTIVPFLWDAFDRCDPTRSHESKPSVRAREDRHTRRIIRAVCFAVAGAAVLVAVVGA